MLPLVAAILIIGEVIWVSSPNIPEASGRYEVDDENPPIRGHLTWVSSGYTAGVRTERRIALGSRCNGDVWLIGTTDAVNSNMGWIVTIEGHLGRPPDQVEEWGRVLNKDWVRDPTVKVTTEAPSAPEELLIRSSTNHLRGNCKLQSKIIRNFPLWKCFPTDDSIPQSSKQDDRWIFTDSHGNWVLGPSYDADTGWAMATHHGGKLPHQITNWRRQDGAGGWILDSGVRAIPKRFVEENEPAPPLPSGDEYCTKFWVEGLSPIDDISFSRSKDDINLRMSYISSDESQVIYWCPSSSPFASNPAWYISAASDINSLQTATDTEPAHCPGWAVCEDIESQPFLQTAPSSTWYHSLEMTALVPTWNVADVQVTCYEDLL
eukprot:TRINITY_DN171_c1_g2_i1.p1 TRINITY_DN171_c1_g2~~TRINITY_DN171_c1_g2_i1.p1  ORF type:complete len:377 (+),score=61.03 TRINITY_DN171_c1_g2_i1:426-1556(+)